MKIVKTDASDKTVKQIGQTVEKTTAIFERIRSSLLAVVGTSLCLLIVFSSQNIQASTTVTYYHTDPLGSPVAATDENGNVVWEENYRPYGSRINRESVGKSNVRWFTGHLQDETGLIYAGARYYNPLIGRFVGVDPMPYESGNIFNFNSYAYANNNPLIYWDPDGKAPKIGRWKAVQKLLPWGFSLNDAGYGPPIGGSRGVSITKDGGLRFGSGFRSASMPRVEVEKQLNQKVSVGGGRSGKQARLRELSNDDKLGSADRGWIKQEQNSIERGQRKSIRNPPGKDLAHERGREAAKGYGYGHSNLQDRDLHRLQHKYDNFGRKNKERPPQ